MPRCEDFPCCGHEAGCCPNFDDAGNQTDMVCTCGARLPVTNRYSICDACMRSAEMDGDEGFDDRDFDDEPDHGEQLENEEFERADEYYGDHHLEDFGDWGYESMHEE
jgi:hypothetical protein